MLSAILLMLLNNQVPDAAKMAKLIQRVSQTEQVDALLVTKMVIVESRGNPNAINWKTGDYGLAQVNRKAHPEVSIACAMNSECGLRAGVRILKNTRRPCEYNLGRSPMTVARMQKCLHYETKLANVTLGVR